MTSLSPRVFEPGFQTDFYCIQNFLADHGYSLNSLGSWAFGVTSGKGRPKRIKWCQVIDIVDEIRVAKGLEPVRRRA